MAINASEGVLSPPISTFLEVFSGYRNGTAIKSTFNDFSGRKTYGTDVPKYHQKIRKKILLPITEFRQQEISGSFSGGRSYQDLRSNPCEVTTVYTQSRPNVNHWTPSAKAMSYINCTESFLQSLIDPVIVDDVVSRALIALTNSTHDTATFAAELHKVINMFRRAFMRNLDNLRSTRPRDWASAWMEGRYGWRTLLYDIESINDAIERLGKSSDFYRAVKGETITTTLSDVSSWGLLNGTVENVNDFTASISYRGIAVGTIAPPSFGGNPIATAWELVPYSFVIDWFINVGQKLQLMTSLLYSGQYRTGMGVRIEFSGTSITSDVSTPQICGQQCLTGTSGVAAISSTYNYRLGVSPSFIPQWKLRLDVFKFIDLYAMLIQMLSRRR